MLSFNLHFFWLTFKYICSYIISQFALLPLWKRLLDTFFCVFLFCRRSPGGVCSLRESVPRLFEPSGSRFLRLVLHGQPGPAAHQGVLSIFLEIVWRFRQRGVLHHRNWKGRRGQSPGVDCWIVAQGVILFSADRSGGCSLCAGETRVWLAEWSLPNSVHRKDLFCH